ncbi:RNA-directed DNA polymerase, eukaryota [Tanacetum coccineum]|uniref:RNA-directed DNA polymerase, eukaryota n=1 Tax=Tanacetum coccineum TaxID=301880 RepID=A0ABQ4ZS73_9ASTR
MFPRIYALEINKDCTVADKLQFSVTSSLRRSVRGGVESSQLAFLQTYIEGTLLSNMEDRWVWDLNGEGVFRVKDVRILLDECFLPKAPTATRWVKYVPIKINVFAWKVFLDRLPTRSNLQHRGVLVSDLLCPLCSSAQEDSSHLFFSCRLATDIVRLVCRWWNLSWTPLGSYADWLNWFNSIRLSSKVKDLLEGVLYITWWSVWMFRNQLLFSSKAPRKDVIFDDIIVAKILANRLFKVIDSIISPEQSAFITGRQIFDGPLILSDIIDWYKKRKKMMLFKVDFEKAFDSVSWRKQISEKRTENQAKTDKTEHGMEKRGKDKVKSKPKSTKVKVNSEKVNGQTRSRHRRILNGPT